MVDEKRVRSYLEPRNLLTTLLSISLLLSVLTAPAWSQPMSPAVIEASPAGAGVQAGAFLASILYFPMKTAYAVVGAVVGGLSYGFSGGNIQTAASIWVPSLYGTYLITPEHLTGQRPIRFIGTP